MCVRSEALLNNKSVATGRVANRGQLMPIIIHGSYPITSDGEKGEFNCPRCRERRAFCVKRWTRYFHIYWIPLIPNNSGSYLECASCGGTWDESIRDYDPVKEQKEFRAKFEEAMLLAMVALAESDGLVTESEIGEIADIVSHLSKSERDVVAVRRALATEEGRTLQKVLKDVADDLNESGRELVIKSLYFVAGADGTVAAEELSLLFSAGKTLGMSKEKVQGILSHLDREP